MNWLNKRKQRKLYKRFREIREIELATPNVTGATVNYDLSEGEYEEYLKVKDSL